MITKNELCAEIEDKFADWANMGFAVEPYLFNLLYREKEENEYLRKRIAELEKKIYEISKS